MPCYHPLQGFRSRDVDPKTGRRPIVFNVARGYRDLPVTLPCGQCVGCRLERSRQWAMRCVHEASLYEDNCFITLTYDDVHLPRDGSLDVREYQLFMKRLRFRYRPTRIRFFHCGEYGERRGRPHYHACLFNHDFADRVFWSQRDDVKLYVSAALQELWPFGFSTVGNVTFESAAYVARYIMKKVTGEAAEEHYGGRKPEYTTMSRRPGIGKGWYEKWNSDVFPRDTVVLRGKAMRPPKYYDRQFELDAAKDFMYMRGRRVQNAKEHSDNNTPDRLRVRETVQKARLNLLPRRVE